MQSEHRPTPARIIGELLLNHPEAGSLLRKASHCRAMAAYSADTTHRRFEAAQTARLAYEELGHRLEPRRRHRINFGIGLLLLLVLGGELAMLDLIELSRLLGGPRSVLPALAATAAWLTAAWLSVMAVRQRDWTLAAVVIGAALPLGLLGLLAALHGSGPRPGWPAVGGHTLGSTVFGALTGTFILVLTAGAAALIAHLEPASLLVARRRWYRARTAYEEAVETEQADAEAAAIATESWLGLVRARVAAIAAGEEHLAETTLALAAGLVGSGRPQLAPY